ncbi:unnamed protein product [Ectocarpus sp. CCAP 1310/34]|nr:unnamed protein product [Ectocarpus sp. CCAP 1310/34]
MEIGVFLLVVVGMDGGHLKGEWNGVMLTLTCKDANNENSHVATVIGPKEDTSLHKTLLRNWKNPKMRDLLEDSKTTFFTDQHKGATCALRGEAPLAQHRYCLRHLLLNLEEEIGSNANSWVFFVARATTKKQFEDILKQHVLPSKPRAYVQIIDDWKRHEWAHSGAPPDTALQDVVTNNLSEQTNSAVGVEARKLPPFELMRSILADTAKKFAHRSTLGNGTWTPYAAATFEDQRKKPAG